VRPFSLVHFLVVFIVLGMSVVVARLCRRGLIPPLAVRIGLGSFLALCELYRYYHDGLRFPDKLPIHLCTAATWATVAACFTLTPLAVEFVYFVGLSAASMALLNPDLPRRVQADFWSYECLRYVAEHGALVIAATALVFGGIARLRPGSMWRANAMFVIFGLSIFAFNWWNGTNYMYIYRKPVNPSLLDLMGPWPIYLIWSEVVALFLSFLLWLPFRRQARESASEDETTRRASSPKAFVEAGGKPAAIQPET
jgi:hypothetical integral membrane protein (TIGR02206 family)